MEEFPEFIISTNRINREGYRILTEGIDTSDFEGNAVCLWNHQRGEDAPLPIGRWTNIKKVNHPEHGLVLVATPVLDRKDLLSQEIADKILAGTISAVSMGIMYSKASLHERMEVIEDTIYMVPVVSKCTLTEISFTDIPCNPDSIKNTLTVADLEEKAGQIAQLSLSTSDFKLIPMHNTIHKKLNLAADAPAHEVVAAIDTLQSNLSARESEVATLTNNLTSATKKVEELTQKLSAAEQEAKQEKATILVEAALSMKKITAQQKDRYMKLAVADYNTTKEVLEGMQACLTISDQLHKDAENLEKGTEKPGEPVELGDKVSAFLSKKHGLNQ